MDRRILLVAGLWAFLAAPGVQAQVLILQNDSYTTGAFGCVAGFALDETMAARFTAPPVAYPYTIDRIRVLACGGSALYSVSIWQDNGTLNPGTLLWQSDTVFQMGDPDAFYDVVPPGPITVTGGTVRVGLSQFLALSGTPGFGEDLNGITPQRNFIRDSNGWHYAETFLVSGDFILRLHVIPSDIIFKDGFQV